MPAQAASADPGSAATAAPEPAATDEFERMSAEFWDGFQAFQRRSADFFTRRLEEDRAFVAKALGCRSPTEFLALQQGWLSDMGEAYAAHGRALLTLAFPEGEAGAGHEHG